MNYSKVKSSSLKWLKRANNKQVNEMKTWTCPRCKKQTDDFPAISRRGNQIGICSQCGSEEAMLDFKLCKSNQKEREDALIKDALWLPSEDYARFLEEMK